MREKPKLRECQKQMIEFGLKNPYCILAAEPGLGKSLSSIYIREKLGGNCLIISPGYLVDNWVDEIRKWAPENRIVSTFKSGNSIYTLFDTDYAVISYDLVQKAEHFFDWADIVVLDEAQSIKTMEAKRTRFIHKSVYEYSIKRLILLTGTPIKNRVAEFYSLLAICNYNPDAPDTRFLDRFPSSIDFADHFSFRHEYNLEIGNRFVPIVKWSGLKNIDELKTYLDGKYLRIKSEDALDLPPIIYKDILISKTPDKGLIRSFNQFFNNDDAKKTSSDVKAQAALKKASITIKYVENLLEEVDSVVVYSDHVASAELIANHFKTTSLTGKVQSTKRMALAKSFQEGSGKVLVATIGALSTGINLTRSNHMVLNDFCWVPGDLKQTIHRIHRMGQKRRCVVHRIYGSPQDKSIMAALEEKMRVINKVT